jgi:hypothetical protein
MGTRLALATSPYLLQREDSRPFPQVRGNELPPVEPR